MRRWVRRKKAFQLSFNGRLKVDFQGSRGTSDGGLLLVELDERLGFGALIERRLADARGKNTQLPLTDLVRQSVYSRLAGYEDVNDAERLPRTRPSADRLRVCAQPLMFTTFAGASMPSTLSVNRRSHLSSAARLSTS